MEDVWAVDAANARSLLYAWRGRSLLVTDANGIVGDGPTTGYYFRETRYLSQLKFSLNGDLPVCCSSAHVNANRLEFTYIYPDVEEADGGGTGSGGQSSVHGILRRGLDLRLALESHVSWLDVSLCLTNRWNDAVSLDLAGER